MTNIQAKHWLSKKTDRVSGFKKDANDEVTKKTRILSFCQQEPPNMVSKRLKMYVSQYGKLIYFFKKNSPSSHDRYNIKCTMN